MGGCGILTAQKKIIYYFLALQCRVKKLLKDCIMANSPENIVLSEMKNFRISMDGFIEAHNRGEDELVDIGFQWRQRFGK